MVLWVFLIIAVLLAVIYSGRIAAAILTTLWVQWVFLIIAVLLAVLYSAWWWIAVAILAMLCILQWHHYKGRPWRKLHYPLMYTYAARSAPFEAVVAEYEGREFDIRRAVSHFVKEVRPNWDDERISTFIEREISRCEQFTDSDLIADALRRCNPKSNQTEITEYLKRIRKALNPSDNSIIIRFIVAGFIEEQYGEMHRGEYLVQVARGEAN